MAGAPISAVTVQSPVASVPPYVSAFPVDWSGEGPTVWPDADVAVNTAPIGSVIGWPSAQSAVSHTEPRPSPCRVSTTEP